MKQITGFDFSNIFVFISLAVAVANFFNKSNRKIAEIIFLILLVSMILSVSYNFGRGLASSRDNSRTFSEIRESISYEAGQEAGYIDAKSAYDYGYTFHEYY